MYRAGEAKAAPKVSSAAAARNKWRMGDIDPDGRGWECVERDVQGAGPEVRASKADAGCGKGL